MNILLSQSERKLLLGLILSINCLFYAHCFIIVVEEYNERIEVEQSEQLFLASNSANERPHFSACFFAPPLYTQFFWIQFFTNPILFILLRKPKPLTLFFSIMTTFVTTLSLLFWIRRSYVDYFLDDIYRLHNAYFGYFSLTSHISEIILAVLSCIFITVQFWLLIRYFAKKIYYHNSLK